MCREAHDKYEAMFHKKTTPETIINRDKVWKNPLRIFYENRREEKSKDRVNNHHKTTLVLTNKTKQPKR